MYGYALTYCNEPLWVCTPLLIRPLCPIGMFSATAMTLMGIDSPTDTTPMGMFSPTAMTPMGMPPSLARPVTTVWAHGCMISSKLPASNKPNYCNQILMIYKGGGG